MSHYYSLQPKQCVHVVKVKSNQLIEMVIFDKGKNKDSGHPMHLHGQPYAVVAMNRYFKSLQLFTPVDFTFFINLVKNTENI